MSFTACLNLYYGFHYFNIFRRLFYYFYPVIFFIGYPYSIYEVLVYKRVMGFIPYSMVH